MKKFLFRIFIFVFISILIVGSIYFFIDMKKVGTKIDSYKNVDIYYNGIILSKAHGKNYSKDGYYYGQKWQCVEYIKRFYYEVKNHKMTDVYGNAKDFFDTTLKQGELNTRRGLVQYKNGGNIKPKEDDLIVFTDTKVGHVGIVTKVSSEYIEVIQQNVYEKTREKYKLINKDEKYYVGEKRNPIGWLRRVYKLKCVNFPKVVIM